MYICKTNITKDTRMMKTIKILAMTLLLGFYAAACSGGDKVITVNELPAAAQTFIGKYFNGKEVMLVKMDKEGMKTYYDVVLADGTKLEFDKKGEWRDIETKSEGVPATLVPTEISSYVSKNYPGQRILQIDRDRSGFQIELSNGLDLEFNKKFQLVEIDD